MSTFRTKKLSTFKIFFRLKFIKEILKEKKVKQFRSVLIVGPNESQSRRMFF